ncbi:type II secretion system F family protein [Nocardioides sp. NPDC092400]|uniref:type II secretion system F family protein n=1 Tax=Nocardioides sp. NPDC092400 TaxID=3155196 RepID=UPI00342B7C91
MTPTVALAVLAAALAAAVLLPGRERLPAAAEVPSAPVADVGWMRRRRLPLAVLAGVGAHLLLGGPAGPLAGLVVAVVAWGVLGRSEPPEVRRRRAAVRRDLPHVVTLLGAAVRAGAAPAEAVELVCRALPGPAADRLAPAVSRLALGVDPGTVWAGLGGDPELAPLGRALARAHTTGAPVVATVERLADELAARARAEVEDRARTVGVRAAVPLGICLLPAFLLVGIVPLVAGLLTELTR